MRSVTSAMLTLARSWFPSDQVLYLSSTRLKQCSPRANSCNRQRSGKDLQETYQVQKALG